MCRSVQCLSIALACAALAGCASRAAAVADAPAARPKNVILFIGDGMGPAQIDATVFTHLAQKLNEDGTPPRLSFEYFPHTGDITTFAADSLVTDSASSATSMASGIKTYNAAIGVDVDKKPVEKVTEIAKRKGMATAVMSSVGINHATPGAFYASVEHRREYDAIFQQLLTADFVDVAVSGGVFGDIYAFGKAKEAADPAKFAFYSTENYDKMSAADAGTRRVIAAFDVDGDKKLKYMSERAAAPTTEPELKDLTVKALELVQPREGGFFMMCEGGSIDWACHDNKIDEAMGEVLALSDAVKATVDYLEKAGELDETLIVVTADHETGGLTITGPYDKVNVPREEITFNFSTKNHTALSVRVYARGPMAERFVGKQDQTTIFHHIKNAIGG